MPPFHWDGQLVSVIAAGATPLPDISFRESAAQMADQAIATNVALLMTLVTTGN